MGEQEISYCDICHKKKPIQRKYYHYPVKCECCGGAYHFEIVRFCEDCNPIAPKRISAVVKPIESD